MKTIGQVMNHQFNHMSKSSRGDQVKDRKQPRSKFSTYFELSTILNVQLTSEQLEIVLKLLESGIDPEILATIVKEIRLESSKLTKNNRLSQSEPNKKPDIFSFCSSSLEFNGKMKQKSHTTEPIRSSKFDDKMRQQKLDSCKKGMFIKDTQESANLKIVHSDMKKHHPQVYPFQKSLQNSNSDNKENVRPQKELLKCRRDASNSVFLERTGAAKGNTKKSVANEVGVAGALRSTGVNQIFQPIPIKNQLNRTSNQSFFSPNSVFLETDVVKYNTADGVGIIVNPLKTVDVKINTPGSVGVNQMIQDVINDSNSKLFDESMEELIEKSNSKSYYESGVGASQMIQDVSNDSNPKLLDELIVDLTKESNFESYYESGVGASQMIQDVSNDSNSKLLDESIVDLTKESNFESYYESDRLDLEFTNFDDLGFFNGNGQPMPMMMENMPTKKTSACKDNSCGEAPLQIKNEIFEDNMNGINENDVHRMLQELTNCFEKSVKLETDYSSMSTSAQPDLFDGFDQEENKPYELLDELNFENINFFGSENNEDNKDLKFLYQSDSNIEGWNFFGPNEENDYKPLFNQSNLDLGESDTGSAADNNYFQSIFGHNETNFDLINGLDDNNKKNENYYKLIDESEFECKYSDTVQYLDTVQLPENPSEFQPENDTTGNKSLKNDCHINEVFPNSESGVLPGINNPKITKIPEILSILNGSDSSDIFSEFFDNSLKENENLEQNSKKTEDLSTDDLISMDFESFFKAVFKKKYTKDSDNSSNQQTLLIDDDDSIEIITDLDSFKVLNAGTTAFGNDLVNNYDDIIVVIDNDELAQHNVLENDLAQINPNNNNCGNAEGHDENLIDMIVLTDDDDCEIQDINYGQENHDAQTDFYVNNDAQTDGYVNNDAQTDGYINNDAQTDFYINNDAQTDGYINNDAQTDGYINNDAFNVDDDVIIELPENITELPENIIDLTIDNEKFTKLFAKKINTDFIKSEDNSSTTISENSTYSFAKKINTDFIKSEDNSSTTISENSTYSFAKNNTVFVKSEDNNSSTSIILENTELLNSPLRKRGRPKNSSRESTIINLSDERSPKKRGAGRPKGSKTTNNNFKMISVKKESFILCMGNYSCKICNKHHETFVELVKHCLTSHYNTVSDNYICGVCNISENSMEKLMRHMENHEENTDKDEKSKKHLFLRFKCPICEKNPNQTETTYLSATIEFTHHLQNKHNLIVLGKCVLCAQELPDKNQFTDHMIDRHALKNEERLDLLCPLCDSKKGMKNNRLRIHFKECHWDYEMKCSICNKILKNSKYTQHVLNDHVSIHLTEKPKFYRCVACLSGFSGLTKLTKHVCPKLTGLKCTHCNQSYPSKKRLAFHMYLHWHKNNFPLECDICFEEFTDETACYNHIRFRHEYNKFVCKYCPKGFKDRVGYSIHQIYHTGNRNCKCKICGKCFFNNTTLKEHEVVHMKVKPHKCHICGAFLSRASRLRIHVKAHSVADNKNTQECFSCSKCRLVVTMKYDLSKHICLSDDEFDIQSVILKQVYLCEFCGECFQDRDALHQHETILHKLRDNKTPYKCRNCGMVFRMYSGLATHRLSHGITTESTTIKSNENHSSSNDSTTTTDFQIPQLFSCERCPKTYSQYTVFNYHRKFGKHRDGTTTAKSNERMKTTKSHFCRICKKLFVSPKSVEMHMTNKHGRDAANEKFTCVICGKQFLSKNSLKMHVMVHSENYNIYCDICDINFKHPAALTSHMKRKHSVPVMKHFCEMCKKGFEFPCDLENHVRTHTGDRPFKCETCGNCFISRQTFYQHVKAHFKNRKYDCSCCDKSFISKFSLMKHRREQLETLTCSICKIRFNSLNELTIHNAELHVKKEKSDSPPLKKKFYCPNCKKAYASSSWFITHVNNCKIAKIMTTPSPAAAENNTSWICSICFNIFTNRFEFDDHLKTHTASKSYKDLAGLLFL